MPPAIDSWNIHLRSVQRLIRVGQPRLDNGTTYIYLIAQSHFEQAALGLFLMPEIDWQQELAESQRLFAKSVEAGDCINRKDYPFNLALLYLEWHLSQWLLEGNADEALLDNSINHYTNAIQKQEQNPLSAFVKFPMSYLLRRDPEHLINFWRVLAKQVDLTTLTGEMALWHRWSDLYLNNKEAATPISSEEFWQPYRSFSRTLKKPTEQPINFYVAAAKIAQETMDLQFSTQEILAALALEPWS